MQIERFSNQHIEDAANLILQNYRAECAAVPSLPFLDSAAETFRTELAALADRGVAGVAAVENGRLFGYLTGWPVEQLFSSNHGVYVPLFAHGATGDRLRVYQRLYAAASAQWVGDNRLVHAITMFAHDTSAVDAWFWNGFGLRCVDSVRDLSTVKADNPLELEVREATAADIALLELLHSEHQRYYQQAPLFMPSVSLEKSLSAWLAEADHRVWLALKQGIPVSYLMLNHGGETFVSDSPDMLNICGAYTAVDVRGSGAASLLLNSIVDWMRQRGFKRLGVDFESFNLYGSRFWNRNFTPFTYSLVRAIDDRIVR